MNRERMRRLAEGRLRESLWGSSHDVHKDLKSLAVLTKTVGTLKRGFQKHSANVSQKAMHLVHEAQVRMSDVENALSAAIHALKDAADQIEKDEDQPVPLSDIESEMGFEVHGGHRA